MSNSATVEARLGLNLSNFKQGLEDAERSHAASTGRMTAAQKKAQADAQKSAKEAAREEEKQLKERVAAADKAYKEQQSHAERFKGETSSVAKELLNANNATDLLASGATKLGEALKLGAAGGIAATVISEVLGKVHEVILEAEKMRLAINDALKPRGGSGGFSLGEIQGQLQKTLQVAGELKEQAESHALWNGMKDAASMTANRVKNGDWKDALGMTGVVNAISPDAAAEKRYGQMDQLSKAAQADTDRAAEKLKKMASIEEARISFGEKAAALKRIELELEEKTGAAVQERFEAEKVGVPLVTTSKQKEAQRAAGFQTGTAERLDAEAQRDASDAIERARDQAAVEANALRSKVGAAQDEVARLEREAAKKRSYADKTENVDKKRGYTSEADQLDVQRQSAALKLTELQRNLQEREVDLARAREQSQNNLLSLTGQEVANRAQIELLTKRIADNNRRMEYPEGGETGRLQLQQQNTEYEAQIKNLQIVEALKTATQRRQERTASRRGRRAEDLAEAREKSALDRAARGVSSTRDKKSVLERARGQRRQDALQRGVDRPAAAQHDFGKALDGSQMAKDIGHMAKTFNLPAKAG